MLRSDTFMYICILTECYILTSSCALGWRSVGLLRLCFFCRPSITNLVFRCGDILMSQQTVTKPLYNHIISNICIIIWIHARHSFVLFSKNLNNQPNMCESKLCQVAQRHVSSANSCSPASGSREAICGTENQSNQTYLGSRGWFQGKVPWDHGF